MLLPAPVWPTTASVSPGAHPEGDPLEHRLPLLVGEPDVVELDLAPRLRVRRGPVGRRPGEAMVTGVSISRKIRSELAIADCRMLYFSDRSDSGW